MLIAIIIVILVVLIISFFRKVKKDSNLENEALAHQQENKAIASKTGIYQIKDRLLFPMSTLPGNGSINSINASFNYNPDMVATVITDKLVLVEFVVVDKSNLKPLYFGMKDTAIVPSYRDIEMDLKRVDWNFQRTLF